MLINQRELFSLKDSYKWHLKKGDKNLAILTLTLAMSMLDWYICGGYLL